MESDITEEDKKLLAAFKTLKVKPKADTAADLENWLSEYSKAATSLPPTPVTVSTSQPRLSIFYGDTDKLTKGEATYDQWKYEVKSLLFEGTYKPETILQSIRRSVKGEAGRIMMRLGPGVNIKDIMEKFESVYGVVDSKECLLSKFYSAKQGAEEDVTSWSCRLEDILSQAVEKGLVGASDTNEMLRSMFWTGLRQDLKDVSGYKFEAVKDFDKLRVELRKIEQQHIGPDIGKHRIATAKSITEKESNGDIAELKNMVKSMSTTVTEMGQQLSEISGVVYRQQPSGADTDRDNRPRQSYGNDNQRQPRDTDYRRRQSDRPPPEHRQRDNRNNQGAGYGDRNANNRQPYRDDRPGYVDRNAVYNQGPSRRDNNYSPRNEPPRTDRYFDNSRDNNQGPLCFRCRQRGHFQWECVTRMDHSRQGNEDQAYQAGRMIGDNPNRLKGELVGTSNEADVTVAGIQTKALLDTGSCVSTISEDFYREHLPHIELQPLDGILHIECANGDSLPYTGFVNIDMTVSGIPLEHTQHCLFLVVPRSNYSDRVPVLLGTNILKQYMTRCRDDIGEKYLQNAALFTPWYLAFRCMTLREKTLKKNNNRLATVRSSEAGVVYIRPNSTINIEGYLGHKMEYQPTCAIVEPAENSVISRILILLQL